MRDTRSEVSGWLQSPGGVAGTGDLLPEVAALDEHSIMPRRWSALPIARESRYAVASARGEPNRLTLTPISRLPT